MPYYCSNLVGNKIRNAASGKIYNDVVGSKNEINYFRVIDTTGNYNEFGKKLRSSRTPNKLFFENKDEYLKFIKPNLLDNLSEINSSCS